MYLLNLYACENFDDFVCSEVYPCIMLKLLLRETDDISVKKYFVVFGNEYY